MTSNQPPRDGEQWDVINKVPAPPRIERNPTEAPRLRDDDGAAVPQARVSIDVEYTGYSSKRGPIIALSILLGVGALSFFMLTSEPVDLEARPPIHFSGSTLQQAGQAPKNITPTEPVKKRTIRIDTEPAGARVIMNENQLSDLTPLEFEAPAETAAQLRLILADHRRFESTVDIGQAKVNHRFQKTPTKQTSKPARLRVVTSPSDASVWLEGRHVGQTPLTLTGLKTVGPVSLKVEKEGFRPHGVVTRLVSDEQTSVGVRLRSSSRPTASSAIFVESNPQGADVEYQSPAGDWRLIGRTDARPLQISSRPGDTLIIRATTKSKESLSRTISIQDSDYSVQFIFKRKPTPVGSLQITGPAGLTAYLGSNELDGFPVKQVQSPAGQHRLVVVDRKTGARAKSDIEILPGKLSRWIVTRHAGGLTLTNADQSKSNQ